VKSLNELFREVILQNELSGNISAALRFSDPDGPSGRSGWSFGVCQFDTKHNDSAIACLRECGFTETQIQDVVAQDVDVKALAHKLVESADIIARYDEAQLSRCLYSAMNVATSKGVMVSDTGAILALADYINQYGSIGDGFTGYLNSVDDDGVQIKEVQEWKLKHTDYGKQHPTDCERRYNNILKVLQENGL
jgi:hypothetical protein